MSKYSVFDDDCNDKETCPHCGCYIDAIYEYFASADIWDFEVERDIECPGCEKRIHVKREIEVTYWIWKDAGPDKPKEDGDGR